MSLPQYLGVRLRLSSSEALLPPPDTVEEQLGGPSILGANHQRVPTLQKQKPGKILPSLSFCFQPSDESLPKAWLLSWIERENGITNAEFYVGKAEEVLPDLYAREGIHADVIVTDPPRKGCDEEVLRTMVQMQPEKIVYVSCNSATLARDLRYLEDHGYRTQKVQPVDLFPHTVHIETIVLLQKLNS